MNMDMSMDPHSNHSGHEMMNHTHGMDMDGMHMGGMMMYFHFGSVTNILIEGWSATKGVGKVFPFLIILKINFNLTFKF